jgi:isopentenyl diphosphate isomerase/L-lactate dehydrogenase-like FMN-dependent dehydrogenase
MWRRAPIFSGLDVSRVKSITPLDITPVYLESLRGSVKGKLLIKGIVTREDAVIALNAGVDGIVVSNHGTDVFKALALGAAGVGIGRPQAWGLAAFGQPGVEAVLDILNTELTNIMRQAGTPTVAAISRAHLV